MAVANVGESMLRGCLSNEQHERKDIKDVGLMMMEMMEPETSLTNPESLSLRVPEKWEEATGIRDFLNATRTSSLLDLRNVSNFCKRKCKDDVDGISSIRFYHRSQPVRASRLMS